MSDFAKWLRAETPYAFPVDAMEIADLANLCAQQHEALWGDQCWHQKSYEDNDWDGDIIHPDSCAGELGCDDPCLLCIGLRAAEEFQEKYG